MSWNPEQLKAITITDKNVVVSAGAGAGKTAVLIARLTKRIIEDRISVDRILAMTFTEAAANEIKKRLTVSLDQEYRKHPDDYLSKQLSLLASANISTIHSFCLYVIKNFHYVIGIDQELANNIMDPSVASFYKKQALDEIFREEYASKSEGFMELLRLQSGSSFQTEPLSKAISTIAIEALSNYDYERWLDECADKYRRYASLQEIPEEFLSLFWALLKRNFEVYQRNLRVMYRILLSDYEMDVVDEMKARLDHAETAKGALDRRDYRSFVELYKENLSFNIRVAKPPVEYKRALAEAEKAFQDIVQIFYPEPMLLNDIAQLRQSALKLSEMVKRYIEAYQKIKRDNKVMDFDDMERFALEILFANDRAVARQLQTVFVDILVDEYQDTNQMQDDIVNVISRGNNVFRVGDIKQSIYRFRKAKPDIMQRLLILEDHMIEKIYLSNNYRSKSNIIGFNNDLFKQMMNVEGLSNNFSEHDISSFGLQEQDEELSPIEIHLIDIAKKDDEDKREKGNEFKAAYIAQQIKTLHDNDPNSRWSDFCVIVTTNAIKDTIRSGLESLNIPCFGKGSAGLFKSRGVLAVLNYLRLLNDASDETALIAVLSTFYQFDDDAIARLYLNERSLAASLSNNHPVVFADIARMRALARCSTLVDVLHEICLIHDFYEAFNNSQQRTNIDLLFDTVRNFQTKSNSIRSLLNLIDQLSGEKDEEATAISEEDDVVKIMTIHQSKGLQFENVFFFSINRKSSRAGDSFLSLNSSLGFALPVISKPDRFTRTDLFTLAVREKERIDDLEERIRVLYVALTRARKKMFIVDYSHEPIINVLYDEIFNEKNYTAWIMASLENMDASNYTIVHAKEMWETTAATAPKICRTVYPRYAPALKQHLFVSPSTIQTDDTIYDLNFDYVDEAAKIGTAVHRLFELLPNRTWTKEEVAALGGEDLKDYIDSILFFNASHIYHKMRTMTIEKEWPFAVNHDGDIIHGSMDLVAFNHEEGIIIDFKSDRNVDESELKKRYQTQLSVYAQAMSIIYPKIKVKAYLYALTLKTFIPIDQS